MHPFCDFVRLLRLQVRIYHNAKVCGNWRLDTHALGATCFHMVTRGDCLLSIPGHLSETRFAEGDLVIFPRELPHTMTPIQPLEGDQRHGHYTDSAAGTGMLCGEVKMFHLYGDQLLRHLPPYLLVRNGPEAPWLADLLSLIVRESERATSAPPVISSVLIDRLSELLFTYALRDYLNAGAASSGFLGLYAHPHISKAIGRVHAEPAARWSLEALAAAAGMSRTRFAQAFKAVSGWTPNHYLTWWRMQLAWEQLSAGQKVGAVALAVGYQSEAAFSRSFAKHFGVSAGQVRRGEVGL